MIGFTILAQFLVAGSIQVIRCRDLVHGVLWLAFTLMSTAATFAYLDAGFVAGIQVMLYTGGVVILMLFAVMLTKRLASGLNWKQTSFAANSKGSPMATGGTSRHL